jgi:hypothetical protein
MKIELHPLCTLFPRLVGPEFEALKADIRVNGLRQPIVLHDGMILDGGNRYRACMEVGIEPEFTEFGGGNLVSFVLSVNLHRRHMSAGQQAAIVASAQDWEKAAKHGGTRVSEQGATLHLATVEGRAAESGASIRTQKMADKVAKTNPELSRQVAHGEISLPKAVESVSPKPKKNATKKVSAPAIPDGMVLYPKEEFDENVRLLDETRKDNESMVKVFEADTQLDEAVKEIRRLNALVTVLEERNRGMMNECNEAKRLARSWKNKFEKLERETKDAGLVDF